MSTLIDLLERSVERHADRRALFMRAGVRTIRYSYADLEQRAHAFARLQQERGLRPGDRVVIWAANTPDWVAAMFGTFLTGGVLVPLDVRSSRDFVERVVAQTEPVLAFAGHAQAEVLRQLEVPAIEFETLTLHVNGRVQSPEITGETLAEIIYTSGTTGDPKGVMLSHHNIASNAEAGLTMIPMNSETRMLSLLPLSHMFEQLGGLFAPLSVGASIAYPTSRQPASLMRTMAEWKPTVIMGVPQVWSLFMNSIEREAASQGRLGAIERLRKVASRLPFPARRVLFRPVLSRFGGKLDFVLSGGAAIDPDIQEKWETMGVAVVEGYGTTECSPVVSGNRRDDRVPGTVGRALPGITIRLAPDGEVQVKGPNVFQGYWRNPAATATAFDEGWYRTGDLGQINDGRLTLKGRKKDLIVLADGQNVYPEDIERPLNHQPGIGEAVVLGLSREGSVQIHAVLLEKEPGAAARAVKAANALLDDRQQILGYTTWPEEDFPRTHTLKVRRPLVEAYALDVASRHGVIAPAVEDTDPLRRLVAQCARYEGEIAEAHALGADLRLDSLGRVELLSAIEEEMGVFVDDEQIGAATTIAELREMVSRGERRPSNHSFPRWPRWGPVRLVRRALLFTTVFPLVKIGYRIEVKGRANFRGMDEPCIIISNHAMHLDPSILLKSMPSPFRQRVAIAAAASDIFSNRVRGFVSALLGNAFPFAKEGSGVRESLEYVGTMLEDGWHVLIFPEGVLTVMGPTKPFKGGVGLLARETGVPVIPMRIDILRAGFYEGKWLPHPRARVRVSIGKPIRVSRDMRFGEATALLERAVKEA